jgi:ABC-type branched-subunit amino acid transport system substrate-binding protein
MFVAVLLAACSPGGIGNGPRPAIAHGPVPGETLGSGSVKVALLLPLSATGNAGQIALAMKNAASLALREFQTADIQILVKDDAGTAEGARAAAAAAITEGAKLILGPLFAQSVTAAASVAKPAGIPMVAFSSDSTTAQKGVYLLSFLPQGDVSRVVRYAAGQGKRSFAALLPNNGYGTVVEATLQKVVADAGGRVFALERYDLDRVSMQAKATAVAGAVKGGTIDAVVMPDAGDAAPFLAQILAAGGVKPAKVKLLGSGQWDDPRILRESNLSGAWFPGPDRAGFDAFAQRYQAAFGAPPLRPASLAYDATSLAAGLAGRFGKNPYSEKILTNPSGFIGVDGAFRFLSNGLSERGLAIYEINHGVIQVIDPAPKNFAKPAF